MEERSDCLNPKCDDLVHRRGLCMECWLKAGRLVRQGITTWESLMSRKKCAADEHFCLRLNPTERWLMQVGPQAEAENR